MGGFEGIYMDLNNFGQIWMDFGVFKWISAVLRRFGCIRKDLDISAGVWANLDGFGWIWTDL